jgi:hypothetical protein
LPFFFFFGVIGVWTQGLMLATQVHCHLRHSASHGSCFFAWGWPWMAILLPMASWVTKITDVYHNTWIICWDGL